MLWLYFGSAAATVVAVGIVIGRVSGELGERLKLGRAWSGAVLLSFATTLPEFVTSVTVSLRGEVGMALGGILGSVVFNLFILVLIDFLDPQPIYHRLSFAHIGTGILGCMLLGLVVAGTAMGHAGVGGPNGPGIGHVSITSFIILAFYLLGQYAMLRVAKNREEESPRMRLRTPLDQWSFTLVVFAYVIAALVILVAATHLGIAAERLAERYRLGATFAGATLLGIVTSLPEITNAVACARQREHDLAVGNILGANALVLAIIFFADLFYTEGRFFYAVGQSDAISAIAMAGLAIVMQGLAIGALAVRSADRVWKLGVASVLLTALYGTILYISYQFSTSVPGVS